MSEFSVCKDCRRAYLDTMVPIGKVIHRLELFVDNADTCLMSPDRDLFDVFG